ncbi:MAG: glycosyltransferase [Firmicutes bacterium]|nr:glycosyltransferase [Bacillota bacterium]
MKDKYEVSVIMPSLNVVECIDECMNSVINQTLKNIEIVCVDAGSTDGTKEKLLYYAKNYPNIVLINSEVKSYGYQVNLGIKFSKGEYFAVLETDDYVERDMYEKLLQIIYKSNADYVKADYDYFFDTASGLRIRNKRSLWTEKEEMYNRVINPQKILHLYANDFNLWKGIYKKSFIIDNGIFLNESPGAAYQDIGFMEQTLACSEKAYYSDLSLYRYRTDRPGSSMYSKNGLRYEVQEFRRLWETPTLKSKIVYKDGFFRHMTQSFISEFDKVIKMCEYDINSEYIKKYYEWFIKIIGKEISECNINIQALGEYYEKFCILKDKPNAYIESIIKAEEKKELNKRIFLEKTKNNNVVIFGAGKRCGTALSVLLDNGRNIIGICDNNSTLWGLEKFGFTISDPNLFIKSADDCIYFVSTKFCYDDIKEQLISQGINENNIVTM